MTLDDVVDEVLVEVWQRSQSVDAALMLLRVPLSEVSRAIIQSRVAKLRSIGVDLEEHPVRTVDGLDVRRLSRIARAAASDPEAYPKPNVWVHADDVSGEEGR